MGTIFRPQIGLLGIAGAVLAAGATWSGVVAYIRWRRLYDAVSGTPSGYLPEFPTMHLAICGILMVTGFIVMFYGTSWHRR